MYFRAYLVNEISTKAQKRRVEKARLRFKTFCLED